MPGSPHVLPRAASIAGALLMLLAAAPSAAQTGATTGISGRVIDSTGAAMAGVQVTLAKPDVGFERTTTTGPAGAWEVRFLTPGAYRLTFELRGFKTLRREGVIVSTGELATVNVTLEVGEVAEAVQVTADARMITTGSATVGRTLDQRELESLPTSARSRSE